MCGTENETAGAAARRPAQNPTSSPYSQVQDYISQVGSYQIIESILDSESVYQGHANIELLRHIKRRRAGE
ncbi:hypothetical protein FNYG_08387 [Fusarium nygamai]|uniref:Uncharacterized protein n=1 Tax=Gibberella nygamai TaxID=42673 RepID=A0A2K0W859_GIBNY|nr:hypothetical protein FNYG_08387 [Fusarium nygamai]